MIHRLLLIIGIPSLDSSSSLPAKMRADLEFIRKMAMRSLDDINTASNILAMLSSELPTLVN